MDWRSMPKGCPERKAAVAAQRRELAAAARAKKAANAQGVLDAFGGTSSGQRGADAGEEVVVGDEKMSMREVVEWVWEYMGEARFPMAPNRKAQELWRYAKKNRDSFLDKYVPMLLRTEKEEEKPPTGKALIGDCLEELAEWWERNRPDAASGGNPLWADAASALVEVLKYDAASFLRKRPIPAFNYPQPSFRNSKPRSMSVSRLSPRQSAMLPGWRQAHALARAARSRCRYRTPLTRSSFSASNNTSPIQPGEAILTCTALLPFIICLEAFGHAFQRAVHTQQP
jgi:hypothetical protein